MSLVVRLWHVSVLCAVAAVGVFAASGLTARQNVLLVGGLILVVIGYLALAVPALRRGVSLAVWVATAIVGAALMCAVSPVAVLLSFGLVPLMFYTLPIKAGITSTVLLMGVAAASVAWHGVDNWHGIVMLLIAASFVSILVGAWLSQIFYLTNRQRETIAQLRESRAQVQYLGHVAGAAEERSQIAQDIHDGMAQQISAMIMLVKAVEHDAPDGRLTLVRRYGELALAECRLLIAHKAFEDTDDIGGLVRDLVQLFEETSDGTRTRVSVELADNPISRLSRLTIHRVLSESLSNCLRHADAEQVRVELTSAGDDVELRVHDDGRGIADGEQAPDPRGGFGIDGMRSRAERIDGTLMIDSAPGEGTEVVLRVPRQPMLVDAIASSEHPQPEGQPR